MTMPTVQTQIQLRNILFATDFSPAACAAIPHAIRLAQLYGANLWALHVSPPAINPLTDPSTWAELEESAAKKRQQQRRALLDIFSGLHPRILIEEGDLRSIFEKAIAENNIDLVVMGTHGRTGMSKLLLGSVAEDIFRGVPCPVLTVGPHLATEYHRNARISRILLATDFGPASTAAAAYAVGLAMQAKACLTLVNVLEEPKVSNVAQWPQIEASSLRRLEELVPAEATHWCVPDYVVERGEPAQRILDVAEQQGSDLIVLGIRPSAGVPGAATHLPFATAHKIVSRAACPVLTVCG
jgi:nucleotide-binding universal stress UspA family protein